MEVVVEMKIEQEELKKQHVCKLCNKGFPNGKSLGGHMRSHVIANTYGSVKKVKKNKKKKSKKFIDGLKGSSFDGDDANHGGGGGSSGSGGYGLRENPKKTWRVVDASFNAKQERVCKQCGKGFQSLKALCGHMSCHSNKERSYSKVVFDDEDDDDSWTNDDNEDEDDDDEDDEDDGFMMESHLGSRVVVDDGADRGSDRRPRRSREVRHKNLGVDVDTMSLANGSSSNSEIEQEQEGAMCLMMLSRDSGIRRTVNVVGNGVNFTGESSDNNSMILEGGSSSNHVGFAAGIKDLKLETNGFHIVDMRTESAFKKLKCVEMDNSDSGYFENGAKELESDASVDGFPRAYGYPKPEVYSGSRVEAFGHFENKNNGTDGDYLKHKLSRVRSPLDYPEAQESSSKKIKLDVVDFRAPKSVPRTNKYECLICHELFDTHQALGGHKMKHKRAGGCGIGSRLLNGELRTIVNYTSPDSDQAKAADRKTGSKKSKVHKCPFCHKVFQSGQALGGHKRSHLIGNGSTSQVKEIPASPVEEKPSLLDLNLPAPVEEEGNAMPW
ncbi:hypothetical protein Droror1_Dr00018832 [Drosera rotundifolia]